MVDIACLRKYPSSELLDRTRGHSSACSLMGHCIESGYGLMGEDGWLSLLDTEATPLLESTVRSSRRERSVKARVVRERRGEEMVTVSAEEL